MTDIQECTVEENTFTEEDIDTVADKATEVLQNILSYFNLGQLEIEEFDGDDGELILDITGDNLAVLIGRHGKTLDALQYMVSTHTAKQLGFRYPLVIDVESYKSRQREKLEDMAFAAAKKALTQSRRIKMRPMSPYERRIIHIALREEPRVATRSEGEGPTRHVVVLPL